jgi:hypothetical protein
MESHSWRKMAALRAAPARSHATRSVSMLAGVGRDAHFVATAARVALAPGCQMSYTWTKLAVINPMCFDCRVVTRDFSVVTRVAY